LALDEPRSPPLPADVRENATNGRRHCARSRALAAEIIRQAGVKRARTVVELGGGTGAFTRSIVDQARDDALILSIEINPTFAKILSSRFERVCVFADSAERVGERSAIAGMFERRLHRQRMAVGIVCAPASGSAVARDQRRAHGRRRVCDLRVRTRVADAIGIAFSRLPLRNILEGQGHARGLAQSAPAFVYRCVR
jgi:hypothetical protein